MSSSLFPHFVNSKTPDELRMAQKVIGSYIDWARAHVNDKIDFSRVSSLLEKYAEEAEVMLSTSSVSSKGSPYSSGANKAPGVHPRTSSPNSWNGLPDVDQVLLDKIPGEIKSSKPIETIHIVQFGEAMCRKVTGKPFEWPNGHTQVSVADAQHANCHDCKTKYMNNKKPPK